VSNPFVERQREREEDERRRREAFSAAMEERRLQRQQELAQGSLNAANDITVAPDVAQAAREKGIPLDIASQTQDEIRRLQQEERARNALQRSPALSRTLEDPNRAVTLGPSAEQLADVDERSV